MITGRIDTHQNLGISALDDINPTETLSRTGSFSEIPRRVLMTADCVGGVWNYSLDLAEALGEFGVQVGIATMGPRPSKAQRRQASLISNLEIFESEYKLEWMDEPWAEVDAAGVWLLELTSRFRPDIVHLNGFSHASLAWVAKVIVVAHSCVNSWWKAVKGCPPPQQFNEYTRRVSAGLERANLVVAPTKAMLEAIDYHYGLSVPSRVVANGRFRSQYTSGKKENFILTAGRLWDEAKGLLFLETLAPELKWPLYAAGESRDPNGSQKPIEKLRALGHLDNQSFAKYLSRASIYAAPALYEPFGLAVLEAAFSGCALVLSAIPSFRESWNEAALLVPPTDKNKWCTSLNNLIDDPELRSFLAQKAQVRAAELQPEKIGSRYFMLYSELLSERERENLVQ